MPDNKKKGRPKKPTDEKKQPVCIKLSPWVKAKLKAMNASKTIEDALIKFWREDVDTIEITKYNKVSKTKKYSGEN